MRTYSRREFVGGLAAGAAALSARSLLAAAAPAGSDFASLLAYFERTAPQLLRPAEGILRYPSIAPSLPGKEYSTSLWDWDTLWTARGLFRYARLQGGPAFRDRVAEHARGSLANFLAHQSAEGRIPIMIGVHTPDAFGSTAPAPAPNHKNQAKPVFAQLALLVADETGDAAWLRPHFDGLLRFHASWRRNNLSGVGLLVWGDDVAIGNDNDPTTFGRPFFSSANLLLNTLYYQDLQAAAELARRLGRTADAARIGGEARALADALLASCWDPRDRFFYTADVQCVDRRAELIPYKRGMDMSWHSLPLRIQTFTGFLPLWCGMAQPEQARALVQANYLADDRFRANWGVRSLSSLERMYCMDFSSNPSNWLGPVWIIVNYLVWRALGNYGYRREARELAGKTVRLLARDLAVNGSLNEYYQPDTGAALSHKGFMDWNLLVLEMAGA
ncbi:MAG TPA: trehalase family glycosidase [Opitutaceae bacterium]|nr:trehalase family glycosidase [Opitutaceae bacterium]